jgi:U3 small nucleolar RNA-associated protein 16
LPALLPDEILAAEPAIRPPTPPPIVTTVIPKKHKFIDADPKPPKDVKKGAVKVRVLEDNKSALPPRASKASKHLKESWLAGQQGRKDSAAKRRKPGGGFLRT